MRTTTMTTTMSKMIWDKTCPRSLTKGFVSTYATDYKDGDGCEDTVEDDDNDNDGIFELD